MGAWQVGAVAAPPKGAGAAADSGQPEPLKALFDRLTKWIPGDVLALYVAAAGALASLGSTVAFWLLVLSTVFTFWFVVLSAYATSSVTKRVWTSALLATVAFLIWSFSVPLSWWQSISGIHANQVLVTVIGAAVGSLFGLAAEGILKRTPA